jgi:biopolymer transport protein TolQ
MFHSPIGMFIMQSSFVVKAILMLLFLASITSWTIIFQRFSLVHQRKKIMNQFEKDFFSASSLEPLFETIQADSNNAFGLKAIFLKGFQTYLASQKNHDSDKKMQKQVARAMRIAQAHDIQGLEKNVTILATIGSNAVYVGLLGTVWGVMSAFVGLGFTAQATIATVAPGIAQALITTAMGLVVAIPAVVAYNLLNTNIDSIDNRYAIFQDELLATISQDKAV